MIMTKNSYYTSQDFEYGPLRVHVIAGIKPSPKLAMLTGDKKKKNTELYQAFENPVKIALIKFSKVVSQMEKKQLHIQIQVLL